LSCDGTFVAGAVADAAPVIARETPAAPNAKAAFLPKAAFPRFLLELRLACDMVEPPRQGFDQWTRGSFRALRRKQSRCRFGSASPNAVANHPERTLRAVVCRIAKGSFDHDIVVAQRERRQWPPFAIYRQRIASQSGRLKSAIA
jgi:hypothetical protein